MRIRAIYSHLNGYEFLAVHRPFEWSEIRLAIHEVDASVCRVKESQEKDRFGSMVYSPKHLNAAFQQVFGRMEWTDRKTRYWVTEDADLIRRTMALTPVKQKQAIEASGKRAIQSYNQTDFVKNRTAVEVQFGKYAFVAYDLFVKHMAFYSSDQIDVGVEILPMKDLQEKMSSGPGYFEGELYNLIRQGKGVPAVPLIMIGVTDETPETNDEFAQLIRRR